LNNYKLPRIGFASLILLLSPQFVLTQSVAPAPTAEEADALFKAQTRSGKREKALPLFLSFTLLRN
jgi:hypothetical protein